MNNPLDPFSYDLPDERIAQRPVHPYDSAKLLVVNRKSGELEQRIFSELPELLLPGDLLIFNDTKVIPARFIGRLSSGSEVEVFLLEQKASAVWRCLGRPLKKFKVGLSINFSGGLAARVLERGSEAEALIEFAAPAGQGLEELLRQEGLMPIPPYIRKGRSDDQDRLDYQTLFAKVEGSIAAPTASLHFTEALLRALNARGVEFDYLTLHVGESSLRPIWREGQERSAPGAEDLIFNSKLLSKVKERRERGARVIGVGTTVTRGLESMLRQPEAQDGDRLSTKLFIQPGFNFLGLDGLITNFHQPHTTHLLLVEAFLGSRSLLAKSYEFALANNFRFLSYGDGMLVA